MPVTAFESWLDSTNDTSTMDSLLAHVQSQTGYAAAFAAGVLLHVGVFTRGEWDLYTTKLLGTSIILNASLAGVLFYSGAEEFGTRWAAFKAASLLSSAVWVGLYSSILVYRGAFHRLNRFPGPFWARISNFYVTSLSVKKFQLYEEVQKLHEKYGDIVRLGELFLDPFRTGHPLTITGPSELSISDPKAFPLIHSNTSPCTKGPWYNILYPVLSLHMMRDNKAHAVRRKTWDKAFSTKGV